MKEEEGCYEGKNETIKEGRKEGIMKRNERK